MTKNTLWTIAKYALAIGVLVYVVYSNWEPSEGRGLRDIWQRHVIDQEPIDGVYLLFAFGLHAFSLFITLIRWYMLVRAQDLPFTILGAVRLGTLGFLCNAFLPGSVGGDFIKAAALAREQSRRTVAVATVIMDRALSLWGLILLVAVVGTPCWFLGLLDSNAIAPSEAIIITADIIVGATIVLWFAMGFFSPERAANFAGTLQRVPKIGESLSEFWLAVWLYRNRPATMALAIGLSTVSNICDILVFNCYVLSLWDGRAGNPLPGLAEHFLLVPVGLVVSGVPLFPGGAGIGEAGFGGLYGLFGSAAANGVLGSFVFRVSGWLIGVLGYVACLAIDRNPPPAPPPVPAPPPA